MAKIKGIALLLLAVLSAISLDVYLQFCKQLAFVRKSLVGPTTGWQDSLTSFACFREFPYFFVLWGLTSIAVLIASLSYFIMLNLKSKRN